MDSSINWSSRLAQISKIPTDITFKFWGADDDDTGVDAHKMILAMASDVFMNMFYVYNTVDASAREMTMEDTTKPAFRIMIDAIYGITTMKRSLEGKSPHEMFAVLYLVSKYNIPELMQAVKECIYSYALTEDSVLEVAHETMEYSTTFEDESQSLLLGCINFLETKFKDVQSFLHIVAENGDRMSTLHKLAVLVRDTPQSPCSNCKMIPCQNGTVITADQFRVGLKMTINPGPSWINSLKCWEGEVLEILSADIVKVKRKCNYLEENQDIVKSGTQDYSISKNGSQRFLFSCFVSE